MPISLPFCQYVYLSVCIRVCPCVCLVSLAWLCLPLLGSAWLCSALRACLAVLRSVWLCLAQKSYGSLWELMEAFFFEIKAWPVLEVQIEVWRQSFGIRWNNSFHTSRKPFSLKSKFSQFWRSKLRPGDRALGYDETAHFIEAASFFFEINA